MKRKISWIVFLSLALSGMAWADSNDPILPGPKVMGVADGLGIGSLISTAVMATPTKADGTGGDVIVWGYRKNGHSGNYNWNGHNVGFEWFQYSSLDDRPKFESVKDLKDPGHPLYGQKISRIFTTAHTIFVQTDSNENGELWGWGDTLYGTAGCVGTGYETGVDSTNAFADYGYPYVNRRMLDGTYVHGPHYQARPCPIFSMTVPTGPYGVPIHEKIKWVDGGEYNVIALTTEGKVYTWGHNYFHQTTRLVKTDPGCTPYDYLAKGVPLDITHYFVDDKTGEPETVVVIGGGYEQQYVVTQNKSTKKYTLWGWGRSFGSSLTDASLLNPTVDDYQVCGTINDFAVPAPIRMHQYDQYADKIIYVNGGYGWTGVLLNDGSVYGSGLLRQLGQGNGSTDDSVFTYNPVLIMGGNSGYPAVSQLIVRYIGGVVALKDDPQSIYTWGGYGDTTIGAYSQVYGDKPMKHQLAGNLKSLGATKEAVFYLTDDNRLYGVGYNDQGVINVCPDTNLNTSWDWYYNNWENKNSMNWFTGNTPENLSPYSGGYRIPYEDWVDVTGKPFCVGTFPAGTYYSGSSRSSVRMFTGYDDGRDGKYPTSYGAAVCYRGMCGVKP
ncbi:MAG: RCC1 domain-containing protein [Betaproteobacteria bacterium]|nr:RCC1 domain-containing protein [Betaproteobacteria bacterium]